MTDKIREFQGEFRWLSNFWPAPMEISFRGKTNVWPSVENVYQAAKLAHSDFEPEQEELLLKLFLEASPGRAKKLGSEVALDLKPWNRARIPTTTAIVEHKFQSNPELLDKLRATATVEIEEGNTWGDRFWGVDLHTGQGANHMGTILALVRVQDHSESARVLDLDAVIAEAVHFDAN